MREGGTVKNVIRYESITVNDTRGAEATFVSSLHIKFNYTTSGTRGILLPQEAVPPATQAAQAEARSKE